MIKDTLIACDIFQAAAKKGFPNRKIPSQSVLQRWLREEWDIHISIQASKNMDHYIDYILSVDKHVDTGPLFDKSLKGLDILEPIPLPKCSFLTYEEALNAGLSAGLNLIS